MQTVTGPIKPILMRIDKIINFFAEARSTQVRGHGARALYRFDSEYENIRLRVKIEINCKEHFNVLDFVEIPFAVDSDWFCGETKIRTYNIHELLGTKLRALYQRSKGRDLFDLDYARSHLDLDYDLILRCFNEYMAFSVGKTPGRKQLLANLAAKKLSKSFAGDMLGLLRDGIEYDQAAAFDWLVDEMLANYDKFVYR